MDNNKWLIEKLADALHNQDWALVRHLEKDIKKEDKNEIYMRVSAINRARVLTRSFSGK